MTAKIVVAALYKFVSLPDYEALREPLLNTMLECGVKGTLLLAEEGINGTVSATREGIDGLLAWLKRDARLADVDHKESYCDEQPFYRTKVKLKKEIVTLGVPGVDPNQKVGTYVEPKDWNALISDPGTILIDRADDTELALGSDILSASLDGYALTKVFGKGTSLDTLKEAMKTRLSRKPRKPASPEA